MMKRAALLLLLAATCPLLSGCLPMMAVSAASMAAEGARGRPTSNETFQPTARDACTRQAAQYGAVHVIDVEQHSIDKIIVWGTVGEGSDKRSFECDYKTRITGFKLRAIHPEE